MRACLQTLAICFSAWTVGVLSLSAQPPAPAPGPEHEKLKKHFEGVWDATVNLMGNEIKASASYKMILGGFWVRENFTGDFGGMKFEGQGTIGYDPAKKKYVITWIDSASPHLIMMEGAFDKEDKVFTETGEGPGPDGKIGKLRSSYQFKDENTIDFTMYRVADGKDEEIMKITYKRKA
jgi:Protein of unknown function (DUF1579)